MKQLKIKFWFSLLTDHTTFNEQKLPKKSTAQNLLPLNLQGN